MTIDCKKYIGTHAVAADGSRYGIFIVDYIRQYDEFMVLETLRGKVSSWELKDLDAFKASYRYCLESYSKDIPLLLESIYQTNKQGL